MDIHALKKAALRPHQFRSKVSSAFAAAGGRGTLCHNGDQTLTVGPDGLHGEDFVRVQVIPGGRYVVGLADTFICLWDVGPPGSTAHPTVLLDTVHLEADHFFTMSNPSQSLSDAFRFAVYIHEGQEQSQR